jgi:hypothetical protein
MTTSSTITVIGVEVFADAHTTGLTKRAGITTKPAVAVIGVEVFADATTIGLT